jgi:hypothetical protein
MIRCRILNLKNFDFISMVKKYSICRFSPRPERVLDKFPHGGDFSPHTVKISCRAVNSMTSMKNINKNP